MSQNKKIIKNNPGKKYSRQDGQISFQHYITNKVFLENYPNCPNDYIYDQFCDYSNNIKSQNTESLFREEKICESILHMYIHTLNPTHWVSIQVFRGGDVKLVYIVTTIPPPVLLNDCLITIVILVYSKLCHQYHDK